MFPAISRLPPAPQYPDVPYVGRYNCDDVRMRTLHAAWNALYERELTDFSFYALAREIGVTGPALYRYYKNLTALGVELAHAATTTLLHELTLGIRQLPPAERSGRQVLLLVVSRYLYFAQRRPRHFALICSRHYADPTDPDRDRDLVELMRRTLTNTLERDATPEEAQRLLALVHGSASLLAIGLPPNIGGILDAVTQFVDGLVVRADRH